MNYKKYAQKRTEKGDDTKYKVKLQVKELIIVLFVVYFLNNYFLNGSIVFINTSEKIKIISDILKYLIFVIAVVLVFRVKYKRKEALKILIGYVFLFIVADASKDYSLLFTWTWIILAKQLPSYKIISGALFCNVLVLFTGVLATIFGFYNDLPTSYRSVLGIRYTFGLGQPNYTGNILVLIAICYAHKKGEKLKGLDYIPLVFITVGCYVFPNSLGSTLVLVLFVCVVWLIQHFVKECNRIICTLFIYKTSIFFAFLSIFLGVINVAKIPILSTIDRLMSSRYTDIYRTWEKVGFSICGQQIDFQELNYFASINRYRNYYVDCSWMYIPMNYGIIFAIVFMYLYFSTMKIFAKRGNVIVTTIFFCGTIYAMEQRILPSIITWIFVIYFAEKIFSNQSNNEMATL